MKKVVLGILTLFVFNCFTLFAKDNLAVLPFSGGSGEDGETIAELFMFDPTINSTFAPIPRTSITRAMRGERSFQLSGGMTDPDSAVLLGRELGAKYVIAGNIARLGDRNLLVIGIINTVTLEEIAGDIETFSKIEEMPQKLPAMARNIVNATKNDSSKLPKLAATRVTVSGNDSSGDILAQILAIYLVKNGSYAVFPRTQSLEKVQDEWDNQTSGDTADKNIVRIGAGTNPRYALSCVARRLGEQTMFNASVIDLESGVQAAGASVNYKTINDGMEVMKTLAFNLSFSSVDSTTNEWQINSEGRLKSIVEFINKQQSGSYTIIINGDFSITENTPIDFSGNGTKTITIKGDARRRTVTFNARSASIQASGRNITLVLGNNLTLDGNGVASTLIQMARSSLTLLDGVILCNSFKAISVYNSVKFTMNGGTIIGNSYGVSVGQEGANSFTMTGGTINGNKETGVEISNGTFTMSGGTISGNNGTGVNLSGGPSWTPIFIMNGGTISSNNSQGVRVIGGRFTMNGGTITGNTSRNNGGGVYVSAEFGSGQGPLYGYFTKTGGTIDSTNSAKEGNVVYISESASSKNKKRNRAAGPNDNMDSTKEGKSGGWE